MAISVARKIAYEILRRVESEGAYASDLLHAELAVTVKPEDAALATEIVLGVLRWRRQLDFLLERHLKKSVQKWALPVAIALRMGIYQLRFLDRVPARAVVNESVELVKKARKTSAAMLVNAVLRRAASEAKEPAEKFILPTANAADRLGILNAHPTWMVERWLGGGGGVEGGAWVKWRRRRYSKRITARRDLVGRCMTFLGMRRLLQGWAARGCGSGPEN